MALPTSGAINLNEIHVEAGGTTGASCTINDSDIRGLISKSSGSAMDFADWYGASSGWSATLTQGNYQGKFCFKGCSYWPAYGYALYETYTGSAGTTLMKSIPTNNLTSDITSTEGSLTDTTFDTISNAKILAITWDTGFGSGNFFYFSLYGHHANSGFTSITVGSTTFLRSAATHTQDYQDDQNFTTNYPYTYWMWGGATNPFGTTDGATHTVTIA